MSKLLLPRGFRNAESLHKRLQTEEESRWIKRGERRALNLFYEMANRVPAYKDFLAANNVSASSIKSAKDFARLPTIDKDNYLRKYSKEMLCWDGDFPDGQWVISTTSGSSGTPYYFPRENSQDWQYAVLADLYLRSNFDIQNHKTLYIDAFPMGAWIGGVFTYEAIKIVAENEGYNLSIITAGIHKQEVINAVKQLGDSYDKIIIGAYAPFLKDILDDGVRDGVDWKSYDLGFVFSAEAFTESFRDYVAKVSGIKDIYRDTLNHYGTVDLGTMSHETPESILIRRKLLEDDKLDVLFPEKRRQATFTQYIPEMFYFEQQDNNLICSAYSGIPLMRYDLKDYGGIINKSDVTQKLQDAGYDINELLQDNKLHDTAWNLPFLYVYERNDFSVSYYAFLIYPDMIRRALQHNQLENDITGKFTMLVDYDETGRQKLHLHIEMKSGVEDSAQLMTKIQDEVNAGLIKESSEYREVTSMVGHDVKPEIILHSYEDSEYFRAGTKQKWVKK
jgi:phenylacetate-CoA ligase